LKKWYQYQLWTPLNYLKNVLWGMLIEHDGLVDSHFNAYTVELDRGMRRGYVTKERMLRHLAAWDKYSPKTEDEIDMAKTFIEITRGWKG
jgi:hypothetical protein